MSELDRGDDHRWGIDSDSWTHRGSGVYCTRCYHPGDGVMTSVTAWLIVGGVGILLGLTGCYLAGGWVAFGIGLSMVGIAFVILALVMLMAMLER